MDSSTLCITLEMQKKNEIKARKTQDFLIPLMSIGGAFKTSIVFLHVIGNEKTRYICWYGICELKTGI